MNILIYGAGVLGSIYAARLKQAGQNISILARGQRLADLREHGIVLEDAFSGERSTTRVKVVHQLAPEDAYELIIVLVRKNQIPSVLRILETNHHRHDVLFMVNNAAGTDIYTHALGHASILLGFPGAGGVRQGYVVRCALSERPTTTLGELNGFSTPRLERLAVVFRSAGFKVNLCSQMDAWLKTHVAIVSPIANALYMAGGDNYRLAHTPEALRLMIRAIREGFRVLNALDIPVTPSRLRLLALLPDVILRAMLRRIFDNKGAEIGMVGHANAARDEMRQLADEFYALAQSTSVRTPAIDRLRTYMDVPTVPPKADTHKPAA